MKKLILQAGQGTVEGAVTLMLFTTFVALLIQLLWILLAQQMMQSATLQIARYVAAGGESIAERVAMQERLLKPLPGYKTHLPRMKRLLPSDETIRQFGKYDAAKDSFRLPADFTALRVRQLSSEAEQEQALLAYVMQQEIIYCMPLHVPIAGAIIRLLYNGVSDSYAQGYCDVLALTTAPTIPIRTQASVPLEHDLWL